MMENGEVNAPPYNCCCHSICKSSCECVDCGKLLNAWSDVEEAVKEVFETKKMLEMLLLSRGDLKAESVFLDHYLTSSWGWRGVLDEPFNVLETLSEILDRLDMQFADDHFESDIDSVKYHRHYHSPSHFDFDISSWDQLDGDPCCVWYHVRFGMFYNSMW
jgi:hypothetical protein